MSSSLDIKTTDLRKRKTPHVAKEDLQIATNDVSPKMHDSSSNNDDLFPQCGSKLNSSCNGIFKSNPYDKTSPNNSFHISHFGQKRLSLSPNNKFVLMPKKTKFPSLSILNSRIFTK